MSSGEPAADSATGKGNEETIEWSFDDDPAEDEPTKDARTARPKKRKRHLAHKEALLRQLPCSEMYETSFMHRDDVTHVAVTPNDFILTAGADGDLRFWKKQPDECVFVKRYRSHKSAVCDLAVSDAGELCATMCHDGTVKIYDVATFDMIVMLRLPFVPGCCAFISKLGAAHKKLAISHLETGEISIYDVGTGSSEAIAKLDALHSSPVTCMAANLASQTVVSSDVKGFIKYWDSDTYEFPGDCVDFKSMFATDLLACAQAKCVPKSIACSPTSSCFAVASSDFSIRVFDFRSGQCTHCLDESIQASAADEEAEHDTVERGRRLNGEKEVVDAFAACDKGPVGAPWSNAVFDETGNFLLFACWPGIKTYNLVERKVERILGQIEGERYMRIALYQGTPKGRKKARADFGMGAAVSQAPTQDPTLVACALHRKRFYLFTNREPEDTDDPTQGRDVFNEKPTEEERLGGDPLGEDSSRSLPGGIILHTSLGDIKFRLWGEKCPRTVENFTTHARNGYYDNIMFHRVIEKFMLQTGDPMGDGTGGESIWGGEFEDEITDLKHDRPGVLSMANAGANTNGSQFFITTVPTPWLDGKHTVFGSVVRGMDTVSLIEKVKVDKKTNKPFEDVRIASITILQDPPM